MLFLGHMKITPFRPLIASIDVFIMSRWSYGWVDGCNISMETGWDQGSRGLFLVVCSHLCLPTFLCRPQLAICPTKQNADGPPWLHQASVVHAQDFPGCATFNFICVLRMQVPLKTVGEQINCLTAPPFPLISPRLVWQHNDVTTSHNHLCRAADVLKHSLGLSSDRPQACT